MLSSLVEGDGCGSPARTGASRSTESRRHETRLSARELQRHPLLRKWLQPRYLDARCLREHALAKPSLCYLVLDDFFREEMLDQVIREHDGLDFCQDDPGANYDSLAVRTDRDAARYLGAELFCSPVWHRYLSYVVDARLQRPGRTVVKYRRHPPDSRGFWIHTDRDPEMAKALVVLGYFNRGWRTRDGGLLQFWKAYAAQNPPEHYPRWQEYLDKPLTFLNERQRFAIELQTEHGPTCAIVDLFDQILPSYNRVVICNFQRDPSYHSISPSAGRQRDGFMQWLF